MAMEATSCEGSDRLNNEYLDNIIFKLTESGFTPHEISNLLEGMVTVTHVYRRLTKNEIKPAKNIRNKVCTKTCYGNRDVLFRRRFSSVFEYCPYCGNKLSIPRAFKIKREARTGDIIE